jgi:preprotein translocase subunit YajC
MLMLLFAQDPGPAGGPAPAPPFWANPMFLLAMLVLFWLIVILPMSRRQRREQQAMLANLKRGAKVVTSAGIIGTVVAVKDTEDEITVRSEDARLKVLKSSVIRVLGSDEGEANK